MNIPSDRHALFARVSIYYSNFAYDDYGSVESKNGKNYERYIFIWNLNTSILDSRGFLPAHLVLVIDRYEDNLSG